MAKKKENSSAARSEAKKDEPINLRSYESFVSHSWVKSLGKKYDTDRLLAKEASDIIIKDFKAIQEDLSLFVSVDTRVKEKKSFLKKLFKKCLENLGKTVITQDTLNHFYEQIHDVCGVRFACAYIDDVKPAIEIVRGLLAKSGYGVYLEDKYPDKNLIDEGDQYGYRSHHFFVEIPTKYDIYGNKKPCLCEIQGRTELQHVWADKSWDLFYKPNGDYEHDKIDIEDMKYISDSLKNIDHRLKNIRKRVEKKKD